MRYLVIFLATALFCCFICNVSGSTVKQINSRQDSVAWIDSVYQSLTTARRIYRAQNQTYK